MSARTPSLAEQGRQLTRLRARIQVILDEAEMAPALIIRFELAMLTELGFGLDLARCAVTGSPDDLSHVSPKSGKAVSRRAAQPYLEYDYRDEDVLLFGRESAGVPDAVAEAADARLVIPIAPGMRSLNVAMAAAMALGEALRQVRGPRA